MEMGFRTTQHMEGLLTMHRYKSVPPSNMISRSWNGDRNLILCQSLSNKMEWLNNWEVLFAELSQGQDR